MWPRFLAVAAILAIFLATYLLRLDDLTVRDAFVAGFSTGAISVVLIFIAYRIALTRLSRRPHS